MCRAAPAQPPPLETHSYQIGQQLVRCGALCLQATNIKFHDGMVPRDVKEEILGQKGVVLWFTGALLPRGAQPHMLHAPCCQKHWCDCLHSGIDSAPASAVQA
jgi:hypothetical protein